MCMSHEKMPAHGAQTLCADELSVHPTCETNVSLEMTLCLFDFLGLCVCVMVCVCESLPATLRP